MKIKLLEPIEGYEEIAELRPAKKHDVIYFAQENRVMVFCGDEQDCVLSIILTPLKQWRPVRDEDVLRAIKGERVQARFMHFNQNGTPFYGDLIGAKCVNNAPHLIASTGVDYPFCEVLR